MDAALRILLIDDSPIDALLTGKLIDRDRPEQSPIEITCAANLEAAKAALASGCFDCAVMDWHLPEGRGSDNIAALHALAPHSPIVVLSGHEDPAATEQALARGARAYLIKKPLRQADNLFGLLSRLARPPSLAMGLTPEHAE